jgi:hypothetical protein
MNNKLFYVFLIFSLWPITASAQTFFSESFEYNGAPLPDYVDRIADEYLRDSPEPAQQRLQQFQSYSELLQQPHDGNQKATWYFIQGLNDLNIISILKQIQSESDIDNQSEIDKYDQKLQQAFKNAMAVDQKSKELTAYMYVIMQRSFEGDLKIEAAQNELRLGGSGDSEASYWFKHWQVIGALKDAGRFDEAEQALNEMNQQLKSAGLQNSAYSLIPQRAAQDLSQARIQFHGQTTKRNKEPVVKKRSETETFIREYWPMVLINGIMLGFMIIAGLMAVKKKH